ncbi:hypothetical protein HPP92_010967 [Vanilla planifolia]|uniref:Uncharacterized protein n=1 Tax=Vanilla planifolia TaxID=51239 RepID=A0A835RAN4_VANPL|nr:hypothetical protein HPP92_010967 [Vanilla planifolia]
MEQHPRTPPGDHICITLPLESCAPTLFEPQRSPIHSPSPTTAVLLRTHSALPPAPPASITAATHPRQAHPVRSPPRDPREGSERRRRAGIHMGHRRPPRRLRHRTRAQGLLVRHSYLAGRGCPHLQPQSRARVATPVHVVTRRGRSSKLPRLPPPLAPICPCHPSPLLLPFRNENHPTVSGWVPQSPMPHAD